MVYSITTALQVVSDVLHRTRRPWSTAYALAEQALSRTSFVTSLQITFLAMPLRYVFTYSPCSNSSERQTDIDSFRCSEHAASGQPGNVLLLQLSSQAKKIMNGHQNSIEPPTSVGAPRWLGVQHVHHRAHCLSLL
jgi:hypothetical protein